MPKVPKGFGCPSPYAHLFSSSIGAEILGFLKYLFSSYYTLLYSFGSFCIN